MLKRVENKEYIEWLENMVTMLSKDFLGLVSVSDDGFLRNNTKYLPNSDDTRRAIRRQNKLNIMQKS